MQYDRDWARAKDRAALLRANRPAAIMPAMIEIQLNGQSQQIAPDTTVAALLEQHGWAQRRVAVECNGQIVPKSQHPLTALRAGDRLEVVHAIGGG